MADNIAEIAQRHGFSPDAARAVAEALRHGGNTMAQFNHPELGGMGQWVAGGMLMIGDMFNNDLKARVGALCRDLAAAPGPIPAAAEQEPAQTSHWWPDYLGTPSATGAQNDMRYACFPDRRRLAVMRDGHVQGLRHGRTSDRRLLAAAERLAEPDLYQPDGLGSAGGSEGGVTSGAAAPGA